MLRFNRSFHLFLNHDDHYNKYKYIYLCITRILYIYGQHDYRGRNIVLATTTTTTSTTIFLDFCPITKNTLPLILHPCKAHTVTITRIYILSNRGD